MQILCGRRILRRLRHGRIHGVEFGFDVSNGFLLIRRQLAGLDDGQIGGEIGRQFVDFGANRGSV